ncbi:hypothetical protein N7490_001823 [Penicillium lividum]|nr:hypothetical protein N7490_001823 [Penicillium lividum]
MCVHEDYHRVLRKFTALSESAKGRARSSIDTQKPPERAPAEIDKFIYILGYSDVHRNFCFWTLGRASLIHDAAHLIIYTVIDARKAGQSAKPPSEFPSAKNMSLFELY